MNKAAGTKELNRSICRLIEQALAVSTPLGALCQVMDKINSRGYQSFDGGDIREGLGRMQGILGQMHREMLEIDNHLKEQGR